MHTALTGYRLTDHRNGNALDNRRCNLRKASIAENNRAKHVVHGASTYKGVSWHKGNRKWRALIKHEKANRWIGTFDSEEEAARAYNHAALELFGEFAVTNAMLGLL